MRVKRLKNKNAEMVAIWKSFEWLLKDKLTSMDNISRVMVREMQTMGATHTMIENYVPQKFREAWKEVAEQQRQRYDQKGSDVNAKGKQNESA